MPKESKKAIIMKSAINLFAEKGYEATGMEEIALKSGIPKSLIYYHFKSKNDLLNTIITGFIDEYNSILHDSQVQGIEKISVYIKFLKRNKDCAKIMISESLKAGNHENLLFKTLTPLIEIDTAQPASMQMDNSHWMTEFFTSIVPSILFVCYEENWCSFFGVSAEQAETDFFAAYRITHGAYHKKIDKESR